MSAFGDFFTSPREREGKSLGKSLMNDADNLPQSFSNINSIDDVYKNYGVKKFDLGGYNSQVKKVFDPARRKLSTQKGQALASTLDRSGRSATPGMKASGLEGNFANAFSDLEGKEASEQLGGYDKQRSQDMDIAKLLESIYANKDSGAANKLNARSSSVGTYLNSLSGTSGFDDVLAGASAVGSIYSAFNPAKSITNNFGKQ